MRVGLWQIDYGKLFFVLGKGVWQWLHTLPEIVKSLHAEIVTDFFDNFVWIFFLQNSFENSLKVALEMSLVKTTLLTPDALPVVVWHRHYFRSNRPSRSINITLRRLLK